ncbi:MAG: aldo/keto reductase [Verrucomicrobiota bacterium]
MQYKPLGQSGINASTIALGTWVMGGGTTWGDNPDDAESIRLIQTALDLGINLIDTAPVYGWGRSETVVGKALKGRREQALIATKCGLWWEDPRGSFFADFDGKPMYRCLRPETLQIEVENSLRRLGTDYIDLYQTHWPAMPPEKTPVEDTMACLLNLKAQGKIREIGVCNVALDELQEYLACGPIVSNQFRYSMLCRDAENDILPCCADKQLATLTYMSLEQGLLTGKVGMDRVFRADEFRSNDAWNPWFSPSNRSRVLQMLASWQDLLAKYNCTLSQLVIAWTAAQPGVTHVLCGTRTLSQLADNAAAANLALEPADIHRMRADALLQISSR